MLMGEAQDLIDMAVIETRHCFAYELRGDAIRLMDIYYCLFIVVYHMPPLRRLLSSANSSCVWEFNLPLGN